MTWQRTRLKYLAAEPIVNGLGESATLEDESWPRYIRTTDFAGPRALRDETKATLHPDVARKAEVRRGDLLMSAAGTVGKTFLYDSDEPACYAGYLVRFRPGPNVDPRFVSYWSETPLFLDQIETGKVTSTIDNFSAGKYQNLSISLPDPGTQRAIADYLDTETARMDALIAKKRRLAEALEDRFQTRLSTALWQSPVERVRLKYLCGLPTSGNRDHQSFTDNDEGVPCLRGLNIRAGRVQLDDLRFISREAHQEQSATRLRVGDVVVVRSGLAGSAAVIPDDLDDCNCVDLVVIRRTPAVHPRWLEYVLNSREAQEQVALRQAGAILTHFNAIDAGNIEVPAHDLATQNAVVEHLHAERSRRDHAGAKLNLQIELLQEHRQALITAAVTGELEVPGVAA